MKSYLSLIPISAKVHRRQSRMTRICIILAVFLVTSIFSLLEMWTNGQTMAMRSNHGDWHIILQNMSEDEAKQIIDSSDVAYSSWYDDINVNADQGYYINGKNAVLYGIEETYVTDIMKYPLEGSYPQNEKEVALSADAKELFNFQIGDNIILNTPAGDFNYTISGFYEDDEDFNDIIDGTCMYMCRATFDEVRSLNGLESMSRFYVRFKNENGLKKTIANIKEQYSLTSENVSENTPVLSLLGASTNESINALYPLAVACFVIILIAGIFMISSCMNSNVAQRTKFFGMMRCIGASKQQIVRFVRLEALNWCKTAIPIGCALGTVTCWVSCAVLKFIVKGEWVDMPLFSVSINGILCGAAVGIITVFIAAQSPAKQASKVSPVAAISGNTGVSGKIVHAANTKFLKVETSLGIHHATGAKKNLILMTGSFALTIMLFLTFSACLDIVHKLLPSVSDFTPDITIASQDDSNSIDPSLAEEISEIPGIESVFGMMYSIECPAEINGNAETVDLYSYGDTMMDSFKKSVISGDMSKIYGNSKYVLAVYSEYTALNVGDKVKIGDEELEIGCVVSEGVGSVSGSAVVVCSEETYTRLTGEQDYAMVGVVLEKDVSEMAVNKIYDLAEGNIIADSREKNSEVSGSYWVFRIAAYSFLAIISLITILNIMNSVSMGVSARIKQYGVMRAVGMGSRQVTKMIAAEAATYSICGTVAGVVLGLLLHHLIYVKVVITHFGGIWKIPFTSIAIILLLVIFSCVISVYAPAKRIRNLAITETINEL
ncbi:ABC transporter permease [Anaerotignum lactatifermentans]|uniref:Putative ABC transport system permease protein n=1 Tax=Anaerotignum lactatifermentans DSM 14214 TaxID=1121323 RepID=A0A1M6P701_9FIRM|nr:ABC transporter permease [Anaerotignum lactatifermentans]SHK03739.1 putative ABC transport system permease protein [[Clostridium] lactatifermentans DSM 14214] [Anaerotignum lactatifermentans DSM 14214]